MVENDRSEERDDGEGWRKEGEGIKDSERLFEREGELIE